MKLFKHRKNVRFSIYILKRIIFIQTKHALNFDLFLPGARRVQSLYVSGHKDTHIFNTNK